MLHNIKQYMADTEKYKTICVTIPPELLEWVDSQVKRGTYATRSHAFRMGIVKLREENN